MNPSNSEWYTMDGLVWASIGSALPLYEMYWRPEKLLPLRYHAGWARTTSAPMLPGLLKPATIWSDVALRQVKEALCDRVPQRSGPAPPPWKSRNAPPAGTPARVDGAGAERDAQPGDEAEVAHQVLVGERFERQRDACIRLRSRAAR